MPIIRKSTYQVIHQLPDSATEWQKDSAVQAYFQPGGDNHYSDRPDTLGLPGQRYDRADSWLPTDSLGYPATFVDTLPVACRPQLHGGMMAEAVAYRAGNDHLVSTLLMGSLFLSLIALAFSANFVLRMAKNFFHADNERVTAVPDTNAELRNQGLLVVFTSILAAVAYYCYSLSRGVTGGIDGSVRELLAVYLAAALGYLLFKAIAYQFVNWVFFDHKKNEQWNKAILFVTAIEGLAFAPVVFLLVYGSLPVHTALMILAIVIFLAKILVIYKCHLIFFRRVGAFLQIILYFCALEMIPLICLVGLLENFNHHLQINF